MPAKKKAINMSQAQQANSMRPNKCDECTKYQTICKQTTNIVTEMDALLERRMQTNQIGSPGLQ